MGRKPSWRRLTASPPPREYMCVGILFTTNPSGVASFVIRLVAILLSVTSGGIRLLPGAASVHGECGHSDCAAQVETASCCGEPLPAEDCPMSGGPCECGVSPLPDPQP